MMKAPQKYCVVSMLIAVLLVGCGTTPPHATPVSTTPSMVTSTPPFVMTQSVTPSPFVMTQSVTPPLAMLTPTPEPIQITPIVTGPSEALLNFSPDSRWLLFIDFNAQTLHFYDIDNSTTCDFPSPIKYQPDHFIAWLPDGRVVVQAATDVETGIPCSVFTPATPQEILALDHSGSSFSPDGRYQIETQILADSSQTSNTLITMKDISSGEVVAKTNFQALAGKSEPGFWINSDHYLIDSTGDRGPLLLMPGKPVVQIVTDIFHLSIKSGSSESEGWIARAGVAQDASRFHLMLIAPAGETYSLMIYHSETGQVETLPYLASQGAISNDGNWLLVTQTDALGQSNVFIRPIDPPGAAFQLFSDQPLPPTWWSPDGGSYYQVSQDSTTLSVFTSPGRILVGTWQAQDYELSPAWSPDGKYLAVWGRKPSDNNKEAIFVIPLPARK